MSDYIDLLALISKVGKLEGVEAYGYIVSRLVKPANLLGNVAVPENVIFARMDVLAVNLSKYRTYLEKHGLCNDYNNDIYMVNGSLVLCVEKGGVYPDWYSVKGTVMMGSTFDQSYVMMYPFRKKGESFEVYANELGVMDVGGWPKDSRAYQSVLHSLDCGSVSIPEDVAALPKFYHLLTQGVVMPVSAQKPLTSVPKEYEETVDNKAQAGSFRIEVRDTIKNKPDKVDFFRDKLSGAAVSSGSFVKSLKKQYAVDSSHSAYLVHMVEALKRHLKQKPSNVASTGRALLKKYLSSYGAYASAAYLGSTAGDYLCGDFSEVADFILGKSDSVSVDGAAWKLCKRAFGDSGLFYAKMLGVVLGISQDKMEALHETCGGLKIDTVKLLTSNPYLVLFLGLDFTYADADYMAYCLGKSMDKGIEEHKMVGVVFDYLNNSQVGSTVYKESDLYTARIGVSLTKAKHSQCLQSGSYLSETLMADIHYYVDQNIPDGAYRYPESGWLKNGYSMVLPVPREAIALGIDASERHGLSVRFGHNGEPHIMSCRMLAKELCVCDKMYGLAGKGSRGLDHARIDALIDEYEGIAGFKLEAAQRKAVHLVDSRVAVITGPAGSGKTTVSECMVYVLENMGVSDIEYAAPTGKAAKRMQEVVKRPVQTFNSKFRIFGGNESLMSSDDSAAAQGKVTYFFDEVAMTNISLMGSVCARLGDCSVYFIGDICQLPPIGKGQPFKDMLRYLPCVQLGVTKRSAEGSGVTYNSMVVNEMSDSGTWSGMKEAADFKVIPCADDDIKRVAEIVCRHHVGVATQSDYDAFKELTGRSDFIEVEGLCKDDIQVVSPIGKQTYSWGTHQMNMALQPVFNPVRDAGKVFRYQVGENSPGTKFCIGDRVIHSESNMYSMQWYDSVDGGIMRKRYGFGISNGEVGKLVAYYPSQTCVFEDEVDVRPAGFDYPDYLRDDNTYVQEGNWFVAVEYFDAVSGSPFYILYRARENFKLSGQGGRVLVGDDMKKLALFYAGTVHKMQGSQARLVIGLLGTVRFGGFLTRNMLYTEITRAQDGVYLIGSVGNDRNSQLSVARRCVPGDGVLTAQGIMFS